MSEPSAPHLDSGPAAVPAATPATSAAATPAAAVAAAPDVAVRGLPPIATTAVALIAVFTLAAHLVVSLVTPYELHRDEFLYLAMGRHLQLWRMDFPPGIALLAEAVRALLGDTLFAVRLVPAVAGAALVALAALLARELGGGRAAQALAAVSVVCNILFLRAASLFQPVVLDQVWWALAFLALARVARTGERRWWILLGVAGGLGLLTKWSILFVGFGVLVALVLTPLRRWLLTPWPYVTLGIALLLGLPSITGQIALDWPIRLQMGGLQEAQLGRVGLGEYAGWQVLFSPPGFVLALAGLVGLLAARALRPYRAIGVACAAVWVLLLVLHGKPYYAGPIFPPLLAAGAVLLERVRGPWLRPTLGWIAGAALVAWAAIGLPLGLPVLPPARMAAYSARLGITPAVTTNRGTVLQLPQDYADMLGWEAQVRAVARVFDSLPPEERRDAVILAANYGRAGAIDWYGPRLGLPGAVCPCGTYWQFGPGVMPGRVAVAVGISDRFLRELFDTVTPAATVREPWGVEEEQEVVISVAKGPRRTLQALWPTISPNYR